MSKYKCTTGKGVYFALAYNFAQAVQVFKKNGVSFIGYDAPVVTRLGVRIGIVG